MNNIENIEEYLRNDIVEVEDCMRSQANGQFPAIKAALDLLVASGGKRIRPSISLLIGKMLNAPRDQLITLASAIELLHTATLVHDDLIDGALFRRGNPTLNAKWSSAATILTGDFLFSCAARLAADTNSISVMKIFAKTLITIVNGEISQLMDSSTIDNQSAYIDRIYSKTASLFETSAYTAALISPVNPNTMDTFRSYGYNIGMAFQIIDDILDYIGDKNNVGKPVGSDLRHGIITLPLILYAKKHPEDEDVATIQKFPEQVAGQLVDDVINKIRKSSAIDDACLEAKNFTDQAISNLSHFDESKEKILLQDLSIYLLNRIK